VADPLKPDSAAAIRRLRDLGLRVVLLTGDHAATARAVAAQTGIDEVFADVPPTAKADVIAGLQARGEIVGMAGDGINDAPALARADVGFAMGSRRRLCDGHRHRRRHRKRQRDLGARLVARHRRRHRSFSCHGDQYSPKFVRCFPLQYLGNPDRGGGALPRDRIVARSDVGRRGDGAVVLHRRQQRQPTSLVSTTSQTEMTTFIVNCAGLGLIALIVWWFWIARP